MKKYEKPVPGCLCIHYGHQKELVVVVWMSEGGNRFAVYASLENCVKLTYRELLVVVSGADERV